MKLELASGYHPTDGYLHTDINQRAPDVHVVCDVFAPLPFPDETFGEIRATDIIEHASWTIIESVLREWSRVLQADGSLFLRMPDFETIAKRFAKDPEALQAQHLAGEPLLQSIAWRVMGGHADDRSVRDGDDWKWNAHYSLWSPETTRWWATKVGLYVDSIQVNAFPNIVASLRKPQRTLLGVVTGPL